MAHFVAWERLVKILFSVIYALVRAVLFFLHVEDNFVFNVAVISMNFDGPYPKIKLQFVY